MTQGKRTIQELLERYDLVPRKALGQHFLADPNLVRKLVGLAEPGQQVVEVGAGTGALTRALGEAGFDVVAYEVDERLQPVLKEVLDGLDNVEVRFAPFPMISGKDRGRWSRTFRTTLVPPCF